MIGTIAAVTTSVAAVCVAIIEYLRYRGMKNEDRPEGGEGHIIVAEGILEEIRASRLESQRSRFRHSAVLASVVIMIVIILYAGGPEPCDGVFKYFDIIGEDSVAMYKSYDSYEYPVGSVYDRRICGWVVKGEYAGFYEYDLGGGSDPVIWPVSISRAVPTLGMNEFIESYSDSLIREYEAGSLEYVGIDSVLVKGKLVHVHAWCADVSGYGPIVYFEDESPSIGR